MINLFCPILQASYRGYEYSANDLLDPRTLLSPLPSFTAQLPNKIYRDIPIPSNKQPPSLSSSPIPRIHLLLLTPAPPSPQQLQKRPSPPPPQPPTPSLPNTLIRPSVALSNFPNAICAFFDLYRFSSVSKSRVSRNVGLMSGYLNPLIISVI